MADVSDVETALRDLIAGWCYPNGTSVASAVTAENGSVAIRIGRGWPTKADLQLALDQDIAHVSIWPLPAETITTRYGRQWTETLPPSPSLAVSYDAVSISFSGTPTAGLNIGLLANGIGYTYQVTAGAGLTDVAAAVAALLGGSASGSVVTLTGATGIKATIGGVGSASQEIRRQERQFQITVWVSSPQTRDALSSFLDLKLAALDFITLQDGAARLRYLRSLPTDKDQLTQLFRRDLIYAVEFALINTVPAVQIVQAQTVQNAQTTYA